MRLLDLFSGAGGAAMGYYKAGFKTIVGVDNKPQKNYPFDFILADALEYPLNGFDLVHASPPCQKFSKASNVHINRGKIYPDHLTPIRKKLFNHGGLWVIENVVNAPMQHTICLCGLMFGLKVFRHRWFEISHLVFQPEHLSHKGKRIGEGYFSIAGGAGRWKSWGTVHRDVSKGTAEQWRDAMGIDWMTRKELTQAVPPAYTEFVGKHLMRILKGQST